MPKIVSTSAVANLFGVSTQTVLNWTRSGKLRSAGTTPGGRYMYAVAELDRFVLAEVGDALLEQSANKTHKLIDRKHMADLGVAIKHQPNLSVETR